MWLERLLADPTVGCIARRRADPPGAPPIEEAVRLLDPCNGTGGGAAATRRRRQSVADIVTRPLRNRRRRLQFRLPGLLVKCGDLQGEARRHSDHRRPNHRTYRGTERPTRLGSVSTDKRRKCGNRTYEDRIGKEEAHLGLRKRTSASSSTTPTAKSHRGRPCVAPGSQVGAGLSICGQR